MPWWWPYIPTKRKVAEARTQYERLLQRQFGPIRPEGRPDDPQRHERSGPAKQAAESSGSPRLTDAEWDLLEKFVRARDIDAEAEVWVKLIGLRRRQLQDEQATGTAVVLWIVRAANTESDPTRRDLARRAVRKGLQQMRNVGRDRRNDDRTEGG